MGLTRELPPSNQLINSNLTDLLQFNQFFTILKGVYNPLSDNRLRYYLKKF